MPKERPIIFSAPMVTAIIKRRKTQTRRIAKNVARVDGGVPYRSANNEWGDEVASCPYGKIGDRLWVRETWLRYQELFFYRATDLDLLPDPLLQVENPAKWKPSIHMPRFASRINLVVTGVRVERLQDITPEDAIREGIYQHGPGNLYWTGAPHPTKGNQKCMESPLAGFRDLWDFINGEKATWRQNPYVWVISFAVEEQPS